MNPLYPKVREQISLPSLVKQHRISLGMTQTEYAKMFGRESATSVSLWEDGKRNVPNIVVERILSDQEQTETGAKVDELIAEIKYRLEK